MKNLLIIVAVLFLVGCSKKQEHPITTGATLPASMVEVQLIGYLGLNLGNWSFTPDSTYAIVNHEWLAGFYERFRADLHSKGVVGWETNFDCNKFAAAYAAAAQMEYYRDAWGKPGAAQALAVGEVWYAQDTGGNHAVAVAITDLGALFIEPQTGEFVILSPSELRGILLKKF